MKLLMILSLTFWTASYAKANDIIAQGEYLAQASDCAACHTSDAAKPYAGGVKFKLPIGTIYSTNITPDSQGIAGYSEKDFSRALREGIAKDGHHLYPAMPYPAYSKFSDQDIHALYLYFMQQVQPISQPNKKNTIPWLISMRWPIAIWNWINLPPVAVPTKSDQQQSVWQRGAWLVEGPGHCGACHSPRGWMMQEQGYSAKDAKFLTGGQVEGWFAPSLRQLPYNEEEVARILKYGYNHTSAVAGPMSAVITHSTQYLTIGDRQAIGIYLTSFSRPKSSTKTKLTSVQVDPEGNYQRYCSTCHGLTGEGIPDLIPSLKNNIIVNADNPASLIKVLSEGATIPKTVGVLPWSMPGYSDKLSDKQLADLASYLRNSFGNHGEKVTTSQVTELRQSH